MPPKEVKLLMIPQPGSKPEFLATLNVVDPSPAVSKLWNSAGVIPDQVVLEGYTRDGWAWKPNTPAFQSFTVESIDGRNKLPGFMSYLQQRQKACYGRFGSKAVWVISYVQSKPSNPNRMECRICLDFKQLIECPLKPAVAASAAPAKKPETGAPSSAPPRKAGAGFLGKLVGAQRRTNQHVIDAKTPTVRLVAKNNSQPPPAATAAATGPECDDDDDEEGRDSIDGDGEEYLGTAYKGTVGAMGIMKTATQVMQEFRQAMETKMLDFDIALDESLSVTLSLPEYTASLPDSEKPKVTMEILKYIVFEAAEDVNEEWVPHKEPSEFMDEAVITVYKEGAAPPEVMEELNKGEMPDEVRGQQAAIQAERMKQANQAEQRKAKTLETLAHTSLQDDDGVAALNTKKRDRRTLEDFEREKKRDKR